MRTPFVVAILAAAAVVCVTTVSAVEEEKGTANVPPGPHLATTFPNGSAWTIDLLVGGTTETLSTLFVVNQADRSEGALYLGHSQWNNKFGFVWDYGWTVEQLRGGEEARLTMDVVRIRFYNKDNDELEESDAKKAGITARRTFLFGSARRLGHIPAIVMRGTEEETKRAATLTIFNNSRGIVLHVHASDRVLKEKLEKANGPPSALDADHVLAAAQPRPDGDYVYFARTDITVPSLWDQYKWVALFTIGFLAFRMYDGYRRAVNIPIKRMVPAENPSSNE